MVQTLSKDISACCSSSAVIFLSVSLSLSVNSSTVSEYFSVASRRCSRVGQEVEVAHQQPHRPQLTASGEMNLKSTYTSCGRVATGYRGYVWSAVDEAEQKGFPERLREASCLNCRKYNTFKKRGWGWKSCAQR